LFRFAIDFAIGVIVLVLGTGAAVGISWILAPTFIGPLFWLPIFYALVTIWLASGVVYSRWGRLAAFAVCLAGWASYAQIQANKAQSEVDRINAANSQIKPRTGVEAVAFRESSCDAICAELLVGKFVKTVYLVNAPQAHVLRLTDGPCQGPSALASKILRDNNRFDLCIDDSVEPGNDGGGLLFTTHSRSDFDFEHYGSLTGFVVSGWMDGRWQRLYERQYGEFDVVQYFPAFAAGFTGGLSGLQRMLWWRRAIKFGEPVTMQNVVSEALGIKLTGAFDTTVIRQQGRGTVTMPNVISPAPPAELAADIERMSKDSDPAVLRQAAGSIARYIQENRTYQPVRVSLERLLADPRPDVKASAYRAFAYGPAALDDALLKFIMDNQPNWQSPALGGVFVRYKEDELRPYEAQFVDAFFTADGDTNRHSGQLAREMVTIALPAWRREVLEQIFNRCSEISESEMRNIGARITSDNGRMSDADVSKLQTSWAPCALQRMPDFGIYSLVDIARGMAWIDRSAAATAILEKRVANPLPAESDIDKSNLKAQLDWLRRYPTFFQEERARAQRFRR
jgi:hypothetical protein